MDTPEAMPSHWTPEYLAAFNGWPSVIAAAVYIFVNTLFVVLRFVSRRLQRSGWAWDDLLVLLSWAVNMAIFSCSLVASLKFGAGYHMEYFATHPDKLTGQGAIFIYVEPKLYCIAITLPRLAILVLYLKIMVQRPMRIACYVIGGLMTALNIANFFAVLFSCFQRAQAWQPDVPSHCVNVEDIYTWATFPNILFDVAILFLPIPVVWRLQTTLRIRFGLLATFAVGSLGLITAIIRWSVCFGNRFFAGDQSWNVSPLNIWVCTEVSTYLICPCLLTLRPLLSKMADTKAATLLRRWLLLWSRMYAAFSEMSRQKTGRNRNETVVVETHIDSEDRALRKQGTAGHRLASIVLAEVGECGYGEAVELPLNRIKVVKEVRVSATAMRE